MRVSYAAENGQPYTAIGRTLIAQGALTRENVSLQSIRTWLIAHPKDAARVMATNASFVFFKEEPVGDPALGSAGAEGVALTLGASLAVDPRIIRSARRSMSRPQDRPKIRARAMCRFAGCSSHRISAEPFAVRYAAICSGVSATRPKP